MIKPFNCKETKKIFDLDLSKKLPISIQKIALRKLEMLDAAIELHDLRVPPANRLESLKGDKKVQYSIRINDQWRICFIWHEGHAHRVETIDYH